MMSFVARLTRVLGIEHPCCCATSGPCKDKTGGGWAVQTLSELVMHPDSYYCKNFAMKFVMKYTSYTDLNTRKYLTPGLGCID